MFILTSCFNKVTSCSYIPFGADEAAARAQGK